MQRIFWVPGSLRRALLRHIEVEFGSRVRVSEGVFFGGGQTFLGDDVFVNIQCFFDGTAEIAVGRGTRIGPYCKFITSSHSISDGIPRVAHSEVACGQPIRIGEGCWLGAAVIVLPGVTLGRGVVVAAGAVVTGDLAPDGLYAGVPARLVRKLPRSC